MPCRRHVGDQTSQKERAVKVEVLRAATIRKETDINKNF